MTYTNIPVSEAIQCVESIFKDNPIPQAELILALLKAILHLNLIEFNGEFYLQIEGFAMGTSLAPILANIYVGWLESQCGIHNHTEIILYRRLIDDIFCIWNGSMESAIAFSQKIGTMRPSLTIKDNFSLDEINFLDVFLYKGQRFLNSGILDTKVYQKPINLYLYIGFTSMEPIHSKKGLIKTELIRYFRICSDELSFNEVSSFFYCRLRDRGYPIQFLDNEFSKVEYGNRQRYLQVSNPEKDKICPIFYKTVFDARLDELKLGNFFRDCNLDEFCQEFTYSTLQVPPMVCYKKGQSLGNLLVKAKAN